VGMVKTGPAVGHALPLRVSLRTFIFPMPRACWEIK
jgi:hypothetical protein